MRFTLVLPILGILGMPGWSQTEPAPIEEDSQEVQEEILSGGPSRGVVASATPIFRWRTTGDLPDLTDRSILTSYEANRRQDLVEEYNARLIEFASSEVGLGWFETGLLAMAADMYVDAASCFDRARLDPEFTSDPYVLTYTAKAALKLRDATGAADYYRAAIEAATHLPPIQFQVRFLQAMDFYQEGMMPDALAEEGVLQESLNSDYPMERVFANYELMLKAWYEGNLKPIYQQWGTLIEALEGVEAREDSPFEERRLRQATELADLVGKGLNGDQFARMKLDEESCDFAFKIGNWRGAIAKLKPWIEAYPLSDYSSLDDEWKDALTWTHLNYAAAEACLGNYEVSAPIFSSILANAPAAEQTQKVVEANCWLGFIHMRNGDFSDAVEYFEEGLALDAQNSQSLNHLLPTDMVQPTIAGGRTPYREKFVRLYRTSLLAAEADGGMGQ
jgi:tetratricopeptide (TPR) repeat protein